jgi:hypothetical protein
VIVPQPQPKSRTQQDSIGPSVLLVTLLEKSVCPESLSEGRVAGTAGETLL